MRASRRKRRKMERCCRREHHRCPSHHHSLAHSICTQRSEQPGRIMNFLYNVFVLTSMVAVLYLMLEYHCSTCNARSNLRALTKNIDHITVGVSFVFIFRSLVLDPYQKREWDGRDGSFCPWRYWNHQIDSSH